MHVFSSCAREVMESIHVSSETNIKGHNYKETQLQCEVGCPDTNAGLPGKVPY